MASNPLFIIPDFFFAFSQMNFAMADMAEFFWRMQRKAWYSILEVDAMPLSLKNLLLRIDL